LTQRGDHNQPYVFRQNVLTAHLQDARARPLLDHP
jgi:hypothetical protein